MSPASSDEQLIEDFQNHLDLANHAFWQMHARHSALLLAYLSNRLPGVSVAEDALHDIWLRVWSALAEGIRAEHFREWLLEQAGVCLGDKMTAEVDREEDQKKTLRICLEELARTQPQATTLLRACLQGRNPASTGETAQITRDEAQRLFTEACSQTQNLQHATASIIPLCFALPTGAEELAPWLEGHLLGLHLRRLVLELEVFQDAPPASGVHLETVFEEWLEPVLRHGLRQVPPPLLWDLLRRPRLLLDLQARILAQGGPCWLRKAEASAELQPLVQRSRERLAAVVVREWRPSATRNPATDSSAAGQPISAAQSEPRRAVWPWLLGLGAAVVFAVLYWPPAREGRLDTWGWNRRAAPGRGTSAPAYLHQLADAAEEWFRQRPTDPETLARRLLEFRLGCTHLLLATHVPLTREGAAWLRESCRTWAARIEQALDLIEAGKVQQGRESADATIRQVVQILRKKAGEM